MLRHWGAHQALRLMRSESSASSPVLEGIEPQRRRRRRPVRTSAQPGPAWVPRRAGSALTRAGARV